MPPPTRLMKAVLQPIKWDENQRVQTLGPEVPVQFNPQTLKVAFTSQTSSADQRGGASTQFTGQASTKLSFELWFDVTAAPPDEAGVTDVRQLTSRISTLMKPRDDLAGAPGGVRFLWGTFLFEGIIESMNETLEFFSEMGKPLRALVSLNLSQQEIQIKFGRQQQPPGTAAPAAAPRQQVRANDTVQGVTGRDGRHGQWPVVAALHGIENPRLVAPGTLIDTRIDGAASQLRNLGGSLVPPLPAIPGV